MANTADLAQLRDIHLPAPIGWWPLAWGWYILLLLLLLVLGLTGIGLARYWRRRRAKREALGLLAQYYKEYQHSADSRLVAGKVSELLKRVALAYFPREAVAGLQGKDWVKFLDFTTPLISHLILELPYQSSQSKADLTPLFTSAKAWIKQRGAACSN